MKKIFFKIKKRASLQKNLKKLQVAQLLKNNFFLFCFSNYTKASDSGEYYYYYYFLLN